MISRNNCFFLIVFTAIMLCMFVGVLTVQASDLTITYDFKTGQFTAPTDGKFVVDVGQNIVFTIINFNRAAFKATINGEQVSDKTNTSAPEQFSVIQPKKDDANKEGAVPKAETTPKYELFALKTIAEDKDNKLSPIEKMDLLLKDLPKIKKLRENLEENVYEAESFPHLEFLKDNAFCEFMDVKPENGIPMALDVLDACEELINKSADTIKSTQKDIQKHGIQGEKILATLMELEKIKNDPDKIKAKLKEIAGYKKTLDSIGITGENCLDFFNKLFQLENLLKEIKENRYIDGIKELLNSIKFENFSVSLTIPSVEGDTVKVTVAIEPVDKKKNQVYHSLQSPIIVKVKWGWKIDFSTGVFFNVNFWKRTYWLELKEDDSTGDSTKVILRENKGKSEFTPIIGALMHVYPRGARFIFRDVKWAGLAFGLGTGEANKLSYYLGTGLMFGAQRRFLINFGAAMIKVDSLLPKYKDKIDQEITRPTDNNGSLVESIYKPRFFLSLTYNL